MKKSLLESFMEQLFEFPLWVKQVIYLRLREHLEGFLSDEFLNTKIEDSFHLYRPKLSYIGKTELLEKEAGLDANLYTFLGMVEEGYDIIVSGNWQYEAAMLAVAAQYPDIKYLNFDYSDAAANSLDNVYGITYASNQIGYFAGLVAAVKSQTGIIGGVVGQNNAGMNQFMAGYIQGASDVNPDIQVIITYVGSYTDPATAKEQAQGMINEGADVIWGCAGGSGNGVFEAVSENPGVWAIGVDTDQYYSMSAKPELQATILTSAEKRCDVAIADAIEKIINGTAPFGTQEVLGYAENAVGLSENQYYKDNMTEDELAIVNSFAEKVASGETVVVDELTEPGVFEQYYNQYGKK